MPIKQTIEAFGEIISGSMDDIPEQAFYMVGNLDEVREKAASIAS